MRYLAAASALIALAGCSSLPAGIRAFNLCSAQCDKRHQGIEVEITGADGIGIRCVCGEAK